MNITRAAECETKRGHSEWFTGTVWQDPIVDTPAPARLRAVRVTFEPGSRTAWHTHPLGQTLLIISGTGRVQTWGEGIREVHAGDTVWIPPGEKHWHGATPTQGMVHIAMHENLDGKHVDWMEPVPDKVFDAQPG